MAIPSDILDWRVRRAASRWRVLVWVLVALTAPAHTLAAADLAAADVRVIVDVSASMAETDPDNLRGRALGMLLRLLPDDGRAGIWTYGEYVNMLVKYDTSSALWKETAAIRTRRLESVGRRSNLLDAVDRASWDRQRREPGPAHLVVLTDGRLDVSDNPEVNAAQKRRLLTELAPELAAAGYKVHTLALSDQADFDLLGQLATLTGGFHGRIESPEALPEGLLSLLGRVAATTTLEVGERGTFRVAPGTRELTVLRLAAKLDERVALVAPEGERLGRDTPRDRVRWHLDDGYELVSLDRPAAGVWRFEGPTPGVRVYVYGDLSVDYLDLPGTVFPGELRSFEFALTSRGRPVVDRDFLDLIDVSARLHGSDGEVPLVVEPAEPGRYRVNLLGLRGRGDYVLETRLWGPTFDQTLSVPFVLDNPLTVEVHPADEGFVLWAQVGAAELDHDSLRVAAVVKRPPAAAKLFPLQRMPTGLWKLALPGAKGLVEIALDIEGNYLNNREFSMRTSPIRVVLPVTKVRYANLDLQGRPLLVAAPLEGQTLVRRPLPEPATPPPGTRAAPQPGDDAALARAGLPGWFAAMVAGVNMVLLALLWWLLGTRRPAVDLARAVSRLRVLSGIDATCETPADSEAGTAAA